MSRNYELTFISKPDLDATNLAAVIEKVKGYIAAEGGNLVKLDQWGMRRLMYPIGKYKEGQYAFATVQLEPTATAKLENRLKLNEDVIRYLLVRAEDAKGEKAPAKPSPVAAEAPVPTPAAVEPIVETAITAPATEAAE